jgi:hypothetical protein
MSNEEQNGFFAKPVLSAVPFPNLIEEMEWYVKKKHAEIVYRKCIKSKRYKWAMKIAYHYGLQDENKKDDTVMALGLALMSVRNSR